MSSYAIARNPWSMDIDAGQPTLRVHLGHSSQIQRVWISRGGSLVLTVEDNRAAHLWEAATGAELFVFQGPDLGVSSAEFSPDGRFLVTGHLNGTARLWDLKIGNLSHLLKGHSSEVDAVTFSPASAFVATLGSDSVRIWDVATGALFRSLNPGATGDATMAFSPSGALLAIGTSDGSLRVWSTNSWQLLYTLAVAKDKVPKPIFSRDDRLVLTCEGDDQVHVWDGHTGKRIGQFAVRGIAAAAFTPGSAGVSAAGVEGLTEWDVAKKSVAGRSRSDWTWLSQAALSPDDRYLLLAGGGIGPTGHRFGKWQLWDLRTRTEVRDVGDETNHEVYAVAFSSDGTFLALATSQYVSVYNLHERTSREDLGSRSTVPLSATMDARSKVLMVGDLSGDTYQWDLERGVQVKELTAPFLEASYIGFSDDQTRAAVGYADFGTILWDVYSGTEIHTFPGRPIVARDWEIYDGRKLVALSEDGKLLLIPMEQNPKAISIVDVSTGSEVGRLSPETGLRTVGLSNDGSRAAVVTEDGLSKVWDVRAGKVLDSTKSDAMDVAFSPSDDELLVMGNRPVAFSPDGKSVLAAAGDQTATIWNLHSRRKVPLFDADVAHSPEHTLCLWQLSPFHVLRSFSGHTGALTTASFSHSGKFVITGAFDGTTRIWDSATATELVRLVSFRDPTGGIVGHAWAVVTPDGRFDTNDLEHLTGMHWSVPDVPLRSLPLEIFMRDYYEPGLLRRLLAGEELPPIRSLGKLNRVQPLVEVKPEWQDAASGLARVRVKVSGNKGVFPHDGKQVEVSTGVYDLRVFRDGQLVGWAPRSSVEWQLKPPPTGPNADELDLQGWREKTRIVLDADGTKRLAFSVQVPRRADLKRVTFTAYAFNEDRVKSATVTGTLAVASELKPRVGKAYIVSVGVNRTESSPNWDLQYAASDARKMSEVLSQKLGTTHQFSAVLPIRLVSDQPGQEKTGEAEATKAHLQSVLDVLAGHRKVDEQLKKEIPGAEGLEKAQPEDLVLLAFSSHGFTDPRGVFHMVLADIGRDEPQDRITEELQKRTLSSDELSGWLREVDAGELVMIVDACHSEATVAYDGFKPGPMGSRGLGQLAYDKGMRILAASKSGQSAIELGGNIKEGLLTYALVHEGLEEGKADFQPKDGKILMSEWLAFGAQEVPNLFNSGNGLKGEKPTVQSTRDIIYLGPDQAPPSYQQPLLFNFAKTETDLLLMSRPSMP
jgi:WD40 repeat protein